jgi:Zn-dependent M28 family amino/carboxypeptidase
VVKHQLVICGHHDAGYVFHLMDRFPRFYPLICTLNIGANVVGLILALLSALIPGFAPWSGIPAAVVGIFVIPSLFFTGKAISPGAGDNMVAVALAREVLAHFIRQKTAGSPLSHTRIVFLSADAEECAFRGSRAWIQAHRQELSSVPASALCLDTIYHADQLVFIDRDRNMLCRLSTELAQSQVATATELGIGASVGRIPFGGGGTDAGSFAEIGIPATCLLGFELDVTKIKSDMAYHTPRDTVDAISPLAVEQCLRVMISHIEKLDLSLI